MELIDSLTFSRVARTLKILKKDLLEDACDEVLSFAIRVGSTDLKLYENFEGKIGNTKSFNYSGGYRYVYLYGNFLAANREMILSSGELPLATIGNFNKYPIGNSKREANESGYSLNVYEGNNQPYKKWRYEYMWQRLNLVTRLYVTHDAILHSPQYKHYISTFEYFDDQTQSKYLKNANELVGWSNGGGQAQRIAASCWQAFINDDENNCYPRSANELVEFAINKLGLKNEKGVNKKSKNKDNFFTTLNTSSCERGTFDRRVNELIKQTKMTKT